VELRLCAAAGNAMRAREEIVVRFDLKNPAAQQDPPAISAQSVGFFTIATTGLDAPGGLFEGVRNGSKPMNVVVPEFTAHAIHQSSPFAGLPNRISVTLMSTVQLAGAERAELTITGLPAGDQGFAHVTLEGYFAVSFCFGEGNEEGKASYTASTGTVLLRVCQNATLHADTLFEVAFKFRNPSVDQTSSVSRISARSLSSTTVGSFDIPAADLDQQGLTINGVVNATDPIRGELTMQTPNPGP
jgi:hypothetical protein